MKPFLLEIGTEEIPARFIPQGIESLKNGLMTLLDDASIDFGESANLQRREGWQY